MAADAGKKVYAIEPLPNFLQTLKKTFKRRKNVEILPLAVGDQVKKGCLIADGPASRVSKTRGEKINFTTIDKLFFDKGINISYLKADIEGSEYNMLLGAKKSIAKNKPKIVVTVYHHLRDAERIAKLIKRIDKNYKIRKTGISHIDGRPILLRARID